MERRISLLIIFSLLVLTVNFVIFLLAFDYTPYDDNFKNSGSLDINNRNLNVLTNSGDLIKQNIEDLSFDDYSSTYDYKKTSKKSRSSSSNSDRRIVVEKDPIVFVDETEVVSDSFLNEKYVTDYIDRGYGDLFALDVSSVTWVELNYLRFDVFIEQNYYDSNTPEIDNFFDDFRDRFDLLESTTGWTSEETFINKLRIDVTELPSLTACTAGQFFPQPGNSSVDLKLASPLYDSNANRTCTWEGHMEVLVHEATHGITPKYIIADPVGVSFGGWWLREGWAEYYEFNLLVLFGDISQATADSTIFAGDSFYNWNDYVANDYNDTTPNNNEIQASQGYSITAWMFSMLREEYNLDWNKFYSLFEENEEILEEAWDRTSNPYFINTVILDMFTRSSDADFSTFQYDGPGGPGWGVRHMEDIIWYADLNPTALTFEDKDYYSHDNITLNATVVNTGDTSLTSVSVKFYSQYYENEPVFIEEKFVDVSIEGGSVLVSSNPFTIYSGFYKFHVRVDEDNIKIELDEDNNNFVTDSLEVRSSGSTCVVDKFGNRNCL